MLNVGLKLTLFSSLLRTLESSPYYAEIMRGRFLSDHNRLRIRRAISLRHRQSSHHAAHPVEDRQSGSVTSRGDTARYNHLNNLRADNTESTILVDDVRKLSSVFLKLTHS